MPILFYLGIGGIILFEIANIYFIMPMPGSQKLDSLELAYFLSHWRWMFRILFGVLIAAGLLPAFRASWWKTGLALSLAALVYNQSNFEMAADAMFLQPKLLTMADLKSNLVPPEKLVLGIELNGETKAYPIQFLGYHHQVLDTVGGDPVMVTYCTVCRSGRVYSPKVKGMPETFRLVGMNHFNAMFEDVTTHSWWRQATGEAVAGPLKGNSLPEIPSTQTTLQQWVALYPNSLIMQRDPDFAPEYDSLHTYDLGIGRGKLTGTDTISWAEKSWIVGIEINHQKAKAFDWNLLKRERIIQDMVGDQPIVLILASDQLSFTAFQRPDTASKFVLQNDTLYLGRQRWDLLGRAISPTEGDLHKIPAYQEFWHSWRTFHPFTTRY